LLVLVAGWVYNRYIAPPPTPRDGSTPATRAPRNNAPRETLPREMPRRSTPSAPEAPQEGGVLRRDVVIKVTDGDTVKLRNAGSIRLIGVDCPEKSQPGGREATAFATRALMGKTIEYELCAKQPTDRYGRGLGFIYAVDSNGRRVLFNAELVKQGYARVYSLRPCTVDEALWNSYYEDARREKRGLFATLGEVPDAASYRRSKRR
jgi:endonuclease YncB( thermonuclease family)